MAFVFEKEREPLFKINKDSNDLGPGQYLPLTEFKFPNPNSVPFGISSGRIFPEKPQPVPGPGSYYKDNDIEKGKKMKENENKNYLKKEKIIKTGKKGASENDPKIKEEIMASKKIKENFENLGFSTKVKRFIPKKTMNVPGPGTYDDKNYKNAKLLEKECVNKKAIIYDTILKRNAIYNVDKKFDPNEMEIDLKKPVKNKNKLNKIKDEQGLISNKSSTDLYKNDKGENDNNLNEFKKNKTCMNFYQRCERDKKEIAKRIEKERKKIKNDVKYRVSSIPSKNNKGYEIEEQTGKWAKKKNPDAFRLFSGEKNDAVGPGSYEVNLPEDWKKRGTSWSKYKWQKTPEKIRPKSSLNVNNVNCEVGNFRKNENNNNNKNNKAALQNSSNMSSNLNMSNNNGTNSLSNAGSSNILTSKGIQNLYKSYTTKQLNFKDPTAHNIEAITENINKRKMPSFIPVNNFPGPGYYYDEINQDGLKKAAAPPLVEKKPILMDEEDGSGFFSEKNQNAIKDLIGPGYYFQDEPGENFKKRIMKKINKKEIPFLSKSKRFDFNTGQGHSHAIKSSNHRKGVNGGDKDKLQTSFTYTNTLDNFGVTSNSSNKMYVKKSKNSMKGVKIKNAKNIENSSSFSYDQSIYSSTNNSSSNNINFFSARPQSIAGTFYRKDRRFREREIEENLHNYVPGPGSYINPFTNTGKSNSVAINGRYMDLRSCRNYIEHNRVNCIKKESNTGTRDTNSFGAKYKEKLPGVGLYEPGKTFTIMYDVMNKTKQGNNTFNSTQLSDRNAIYQFQKNLPNGPGCYYQDKFVKLQQIPAAFNSTTNRFLKGGINNTRDQFRTQQKDINAIVSSYNPKQNNLSDSFKKGNGNSNNFSQNVDQENIVGPGRYEFSNERFPWVKPSFNAKYI